MTNGSSFGSKLKRIEGLTAIPPAPGRPTEPAALPVEVVETLSKERLLTEAQAFCKDGWAFVNAAEAKGFGVYTSPAGRLYILGNMLNVKFAPDASPDDIANLLDKHRLSKKRTLGFAKNLMTVTAAEGLLEDPLLLSRRLANELQIEFAEPVMMERIGHRE